MHYSVIVVGGGIVGLSAARSLVARGVQNVLVLEQRFPAAGASGLGTGSVHCQRWRSLDVQLVMRSKQILAELEDPTNGLTALRPTGRLTLVANEDSAALAKYAEMIESFGVALSMIEVGDIAKRFPYLNLDDIAVGCYTPNDGVVSPPSITWGLAGLIRARGGNIWEGVEAQRAKVIDGRVTGVELADGTTLSADCVVVATGLWTEDFLAASNVHIPDQRVVTQNTVLSLSDQGRMWGVPNILDIPSGDVTFIPRNQGNICVGGWVRTVQLGASPVGAEYGAESDGAYNDAMFDIASRRFDPRAIGGVIGGWKGVVDVAPDLLPLIGEVDNAGGLFVACGLGGYGIQRGPAVGEAVADLALGKSTRVDLVDCDPNRFDSEAGPTDPLHTEIDNAFSSAREG
jgi:sarcosine oxidase subunit beta